MCAMLLYGPERHPIALFGQWACVEPNGSGPPTTALGPAVLALWSPLPMYMHMYMYMYAMQWHTHYVRVCTSPARAMMQ